MIRPIHSAVVSCDIFPNFLNSGTSSVVKKNFWALKFFRLFAEL